MKGIPKVLNSQFDYMKLKENFSEEVWKPAFEQLLEHRKDWWNVGEVKDGITDSTHKVEYSFDGEKKYQFELRETINPLLTTLGWTEDDVKKILESR